MFFMKKLVASAVLAALGSPLVAAPLPPGGVIFPTGTTNAADPDLAGTVINDNLIDVLFGSGFFIASYKVQNRVVRSNNLGTLAFYPRIRDPLNLGFAERLEVIGFRLTGYAEATLTDVDFRTDGSGDKGPSSVSRSLDGDTLTFRYEDPLINDAFNPPGVRDTSLFPLLKTEQKWYRKTGTLTIFARAAGSDPDDPLESVTISGIAVPTVVPLPASALLLVGGIAGLGLMGRRKRT